MRLRYEHRFERLLEPFEIHPGIFLPARSYDWDEGSVRIETNRKRILAGTVDVGAGTFFSGERLSALGQLVFHPNKHFLASLIYDHNQIWLPEGDFQVQLAILSTTVQFTPDISWITRGQWDNVSDKLGFNSRFRWIIQDGREFYIIVNHDADTRNEFRSERTEAILKLALLGLRDRISAWRDLEAARGASLPPHRDRCQDRGISFWGVCRGS